ncbi:MULTISPECIES: 16S rRNA (guanine(966)-N(2))-methyltransferase RsmD [Desulfococcus]|uniref:Methyltransferase n=1 Tax=Desulfococcus multivorans DSM 2059 TaxID=1121405 RepID=S7TQK1_DESML|nr:16S rRNA (guanine(966)-N(2))-methyltransferase RsmD [Desulfococcus multivorans]EPR38940.1 methyltransferase [Desulfococcus multivorans DSM 2059]MDX9818216.1 16S rRNA (guanine(966)-N(2))-methyltransferase RsmD [Desulfococcus multivorans]SJZ66863.1 16S rRNA (guanine966-N2)-methyltransferase [Desulfococcus multivorans DSM 2059]
MRIISGRLRGRKLLPIRGNAVRPTSDRVREAIFNIIGRNIAEARVLDLFAGTGAMGIEALSRDARSAIFIDNRKASVAAVRKNLEHLGLTERSRVVLWDIDRNLNCLTPHEPDIHLVFMDPPYHKNLIGPALFHLRQRRILAPGALVVVEHAASEPLPEQLSGYDLSDQRKYGKTLVSFLNYAMNAPNKS